MLSTITHALSNGFTKATSFFLYIYSYLLPHFIYLLFCSIYSSLFPVSSLLFVGRLRFLRISSLWKRKGTNFESGNWERWWFAWYLALEGSCRGTTVRVVAKLWGEFHFIQPYIIYVYSTLPATDPSVSSVLCFLASVFIFHVALYRLLLYCELER